MKITRKITIEMTDEEALDFASGSPINYKAKLTRPIANTIPFETEEYDNPLSVEEAINEAVDNGIVKLTNDLLSDYKNRKINEAINDIAVAFDDAKEEAQLAIEARQSEVVSVTV